MIKIIYDSIYKFMTECPLLKNDGVNINYLSESPVSYTIEPLPNSPVIKKYTDGSSLCQYDFVFASREYYNQDIVNNKSITEFYEKLQDWIENQKGNLPDFEDEKLTAQSLYVTSGGYLYDQTETTARYQIQCKLIYLKQEV